MAALEARIVNVPESLEELERQLTLFEKPENRHEEVLFMHNYTKQYCVCKVADILTELRTFKDMGMAIYQKNCQVKTVNNVDYFMLVVSCHNATGTDAEMVNIMALSLGLGISGFVYLLRMSAYEANKTTIYRSITTFPVASIIVMVPNVNNARTIEVNPEGRLPLDRYFTTEPPEGYAKFECMTTQHKTGESDYFAVFFEGHDLGEHNDAARWIAKLFDVSPTGTFVICHKKWENGEEVNKPVDKTLKELKELFKP